MGTTVSNLQILGASEDAVRTALPHALVGTWSKRFVTACPDPGRRQLARVAVSLSKKLGCTLLLTDMFDGDDLWLTVYQNGKRLTGHKALLSSGECTVGNPKLFCSALELPEELAPKLRRLFADCSMQEEKLEIFQSLLGAPLFLRWDDDSALAQPVKADPAPLLQWVEEHPLPPKIKNQCKAEIIQEIPERGLDSNQNIGVMILRPLARVGEDGYTDWTLYGFKVGDVIGCSFPGGEWCRTLPDGRLELISLEDPPIPEKLWTDMFPGSGSPRNYSGGYEYTALDERVVTVASLCPSEPNYFRGYVAVCSAILHDTAGILSPHILTLDGEPAVGKLHLLPNGGYLAAVEARYDDSCPPVQIRKPALVSYGPDGTQRWKVWGVNDVVNIMDGLIYATSYCEDDGGTSHRLLAITLNGAVVAQCPDPPFFRDIHVMGGAIYLPKSQGFRKDGLLRRLTPNLEPDGEVSVPYMSSFALSPDRTLLLCAGFQFGLQVMDAATLRVLARLDRRDDFHSPIIDRQNRLWVGNKSYFECYDPNLTLISRHRLAGDICSLHHTADGDVCAVTIQEKRHLFRVYRFS